MTALQGACLALTILAGAIFAHPYLSYPLSLAVLARRHPMPLAIGDRAPTDGGEFAIFFCAFNEQRAMPSKIANVRELLARYPNLKVYAYDDGSNDGTPDLLAQEPGIQLIRGPGHAGKAHGMKLMVAAASERFLVFTDANVELDLNCIDELAKTYADPDVGGICGSLVYRNGNDGSTTAQGGGLYWSLEERIKELESRTGSVIGADGSIFSVRREMYPTFPDSVQDDFTVSMNVLFSDARLVRAPHVTAYEELVTDRRDELARRVRIATRAYHTHREMRSRIKQLSTLDRYKYLSHKVLRWWGAVPMAISVASSVVFLCTFGLIGYVLIAVAALCLAGLRMLKMRLVLLVAELGVSIAATTFGAIRALRGVTVTTWTPPASR